jgi:hypothetical protein
MNTNFLTSVVEIVFPLWDIIDAVTSTHGRKERVAGIKVWRSDGEMKMFLMKPGRLLVSAAFAGLLAFAATPASAVSTVCDLSGSPPLSNAFIATGIDVYASCEVGDPSARGGNDSADQVNLDTMFGLSDWVNLGRVEGGSGTGGILTNFDSGGMLSGTWSFASSVWAGFANIMLVLKDGNAPTTIPNSYVGYLLVFGDFDGLWQSPFTNSNGTTQKQLSHMTAYGSVIPLPAALPMFLLALGGLGFVGRRRRQAAA